MSSDRYTASKAREVENARLVWLDAKLRTSAAQTLEDYLAACRVDETLYFLEADLQAWTDGHAALVRRVAELPAGDAAHAHVFGLRKVAKSTTRRDGEERRGAWLVSPCTCGRVAV